MKSKFTKIAVLLFAVGLSTFFFFSCTVQDLTQDLTLYTGNGFLVNPLSIQVGDAAKLQNVPGQLTISVEGRDKDKIYTMFGEKNIRAIGGIISLAVKTIDVPSTTQPLVFTLVFSAPNYTTVRKNYSLTSNAELKADNVKMINLSAPPSGISVQATSFTSSATGTAQDVPFASPLSNGKLEQVNLTLKAGTQPLSAAGSVLSGTIQTQLVHFDARSESSLDALPDGSTGLTVKQGTASSQVNMSIAGYYSMNMTVGTTKVAKFSAPMDVVIDIDPEYYNPAQSRKVQEGDILDVISRDESETTWTNETRATVTKVNGKLKAIFKQPHLSTWVIGTKKNVECTQLITFSTDLPTASTSKNADCSIARETFRYSLIDANSFQVYGTGTSTLGNGEVSNDKVASDSKTMVKLVVFDADFNRIYTTPAQNLCTSSTFDLKGKLPANKSVVVKLNVSAFCGGAINTVFTPSNVTLMYRNMASPANAPFGGWLPLVSIVDGKGCAKGLKVGQAYDFGLAIPVSATQIEMQTFSKDLKQTKGLTIPTSDLTIDVVSDVYNINKTLTIKKQTDGSYNLDYTKYALPDNICTELNKKFSVFAKK